MNKSIVITILLIFSLAFVAQAQHKPHPKKQVKKHVNSPKKVKSKKIKHVHVHNKKYHHLPRRGSVVKVTPGGAVVIKHRGTNYRYHNGIWYKPHGNRFVVWRPYRGLRVRVLPPKHRVVVVQNRTYYYYNGTYYNSVEGADEYEVVEAPIGATVEALPEDYTTEEIDGEEFYVVDDVYYYYDEVENLYEVVEVNK